MLRVGTKRYMRTAENDSSLHCHPGHHQVENIATDIVKVHVSKASGDDLLPEIWSLVIDRDVDTDLVLKPFGLVVGTGDSDDSEAQDFSDLTGDRTHSTGCTGDKESFPGLDLANINQALGVSTGISTPNGEVALRWLTK